MDPSALYISISPSASGRGLMRIRPSPPTPKRRWDTAMAALAGSASVSLNRSTYT
jgi:hypothetical protein